VALLVVLDGKLEAIDPIVEHLKLPPILVEGVSFCYLIVLTYEAEK
jgi:hypothetical protein